MVRVSAAMAIVLCLAACRESETTQSETPPVRGLITVEVAAAEQTTRRRYPGVLEPTEITSLSFEVGGRLQEVNLEVGQRVGRLRQLTGLDLDQQCGVHPQT